MEAEGKESPQEETGFSLLKAATAMTSKMKGQVSLGFGMMAALDDLKNSFHENVEKPDWSHLNSYLEVEAGKKIFFTMEIKIVSSEDFRTEEEFSKM